MFFKIGAPKNFAGKTPVLESLFKNVNEVPGFMPATLLKRDFNTGVFLWNLLLFKINNNNNLVEDISAIPLTHKKSLITWSSHNELTN